MAYFCCDCAVLFVYKCRLPWTWMKTTTTTTTADNRQLSRQLAWLIVLMTPCSVMWTPGWIRKSEDPLTEETQTLAIRYQHGNGYRYRSHDRANLRVSRLICGVDSMEKSLVTNQNFYVVMVWYVHERWITIGFLISGFLLQQLNVPCEPRKTQMQLLWGVLVSL